jgi:hypothetical protein
MLLAHMLKHFDADDLFEFLVDFEIAVVTDFDAAAVVKTWVANPLSGYLRLPDTQGDPQNTCAIVHGGINE